MSNPITTILRYIMFIGAIFVIYMSFQDYTSEQSIDFDLTDYSKNISGVDYRLQALKVADKDAELDFLVVEETGDILNLKITAKYDSELIKIGSTDILVMNLKYMKEKEVKKTESEKGFFKKTFGSVIDSTYDLSKIQENFNKIEVYRTGNYFVTGLELKNGKVVETTSGTWWEILIFIMIALMSISKELGIWAIELYQKYLSPKKGYKCAKGVLHENGTCSSSVKKVMKEEGFFAGMREYSKSTSECRDAKVELDRRANNNRKNENCDQCDESNCGNKHCNSLGSATVMGCDIAEAGSGAASGCSDCGAGAGDCGAGGCDGVGSC